MKSSTVRHALVAIALAAVLAPFVSASAAPAPAAKPAARPAGGASRLSAAMPDSVLARVFTGTGQGQVHLVTQRQMVAAAARAGKLVDRLTPQDRREFLDVLVDQAVLVARVRQEPRAWDRRDSTDWNVLRDRLVLRAALDSAMVAANFERAARGESLLTRQELGVLLREQAVAQLAPKWNEDAVRKAVSVFDTLPRPDGRMSMLEQMRVAGARPTVSDADGAMRLAESSAGDYTLGELVRDYVRLNPLYRPRLDGPDQVKEMVGNVLFENVLRRNGIAQGLERRPDIAGPLAERAEYLDVARFVGREVYAKIAMDSLTLRRHYEKTRPDYDWDERARIVSLALPTRAEAEAMLSRLTVPAEAESLAAQSARAGTSYSTMLTRMSDTLLFARMKRGGVGAVLGPDSTSQGWRVLRVMALEPRRPRSFADAEPLVRQHWSDAEGERLMRALLDGLRQRAVVVVNERALAKPLPAPPTRRVDARR